MGNYDKSYIPVFSMLLCGAISFPLTAYAGGGHEELEPEPMMAITTSSRYTAQFGPSGGYGYVVVKDSQGRTVFKCKASNVTMNRDRGSRNVPRSNRPTPIGRYKLNPKQNLSDRPGVFVDVPTRVGIFIHSTVPGSRFGWYPTNGCIRVEPQSVRKLKQLLPGHKPLINVINDPIPDMPAWTNPRYRPIKYGAGQDFLNFNERTDVGVDSFGAPGWHYSPDGDYIVELPGERYVQRHGTSYIKVFKVIAKKDNIVTKRLVMRRTLYWTGISGFRWLPERPHSFVIASKFVDGRAFIAMWDPQNRLQVLRMITPAKNEDPDAVGFVLEAVRQNGTSLGYQSYGASGPESQNYNAPGTTGSSQLQWLRLPKE